MAPAGMFRPSALLGKPDVLLELQWQGRGGKFRHIALSSRSLLRALGILGIVVVIALGAVGASFVRSNRAPADSGVDTVLREQAQLKARHDALRERVFDLADQLYWHFDEERRMARLAGTAGHAWVVECPLPPARDAEDEALLAWLSEQGARLEQLGNTSPASRVEMVAQQASAPATVNGIRVSTRGEPARRPEGLEPAKGHAAATR
jgi:hypothetical protein